MADSRFNPNDPARNKNRALMGAPGTDAYPQQVAAYNQWLYTPKDRRPGTEATAGFEYLPPDPSLSQYTRGWQQPSAAGSSDIALRYGGAQNFTPPTPAYGGSPINPAAPPTSTPSIIDTAPKATFTPSMQAPSVPQNSMQRWSQGQRDEPQGIKPLSDQRRYFWATNHIDARPTVSPQQSTPSPVTFVNSPSQWTAY